MKKSLIALAVLTASGVSFAQSSVTLYGIVDLGMQNTSKSMSTTLNSDQSGDINATSSKDTKMANGVQSGGRIGFKGTEDLGGGMKANFVVENGITPDESTTAFGTSNRQSFVSLEGGFGSVALGRQYTLHHSNQGAGDMFGNIGNAGYIGGLDSLVRASNAITYTTPTIGGITAAVQYASKDDDLDLTAGHVRYAAGALTVGFTSEVTKKGSFAGLKGAFVDGNANAESDWIPSLDGKRTANNLSATYDFGVAKVGFVNNNTKYGSSKWAANTVSAAVPMGALTLLASAGSGKMTANDADNSNPGEFDAVVKAKAYQLGATYALSKRTNAYIFTGNTKYSYSDDATDVGTNKNTQTVVGIRHAF